ncbi:MAG: ABC transporter ATP-binding protein [Oscillospiraceae bacterium]|jgi:putative ABC transport system ATP-binding protein|nr:ABC transporter ATP-binding protein [Oscillospiraceae bacterium]
MPEKILIQLENMSKTYGGGNSIIHALKDISLEIMRGEFAAIIGQSGSGKSTLMNTLGCLDLPDTGRYLLNGRDVSRIPEKELSVIRNREIGFVFQSFNLVPGMNAAENVELPLFYRGLDRKARREEALAALEKVGLSHRSGHLPSRLSGGQQQRVAIARALCGQPSLILADEPTGNLDSASGAEIMRLLLDINREGKTVVLITHNDKIAKSAGRVLKISDGRLIA